MGFMLSSALKAHLNELRLEPVGKRVRAQLGGVTALDSQRAVLVWEPRRVVPSYAVPVTDVCGSVDEATPIVAVSPAVALAPGVAVTVTAAVAPEVKRRPVWDPRVPFAVRDTAGRCVVISIAGTDAVASGFQPDDSDLANYVILDFNGFDTWLEDDDEIVSHPHDPFSRIDIRHTSRQVHVSLHGHPIAASTNVRILYETGLPPRYYFPREDIQVELTASQTVTRCAYKGTATYYSPVVGGVAVPDLAWSYEDPLVDAAGVAGCVAFFTERVDVAIDGELQARPHTAWS
ncbi:DUF427 domain-containing protein [Rathayibacter soli]|uniref:DUF427 domain-containing protein n=1 Tax=Rathayibacter soli TaxID=3144168 RepID=UPI0027E40D91|nr:DUF427 domain-containing protein [Glaciibacter superstes]